MPKSLQNKVITIFGGTGFLGRHIVSRLARTGETTGPVIKIPTRRAASAYFLRQYGAVGHIVPISCDFTPESIDAAIRSSDVVINCIGILNESRGAKFGRVHDDIARMIAEASARHGVSRLIHVSALGVGQSASRYAESKRAGEASVMTAYPNAIIMRPSLIFGPEDRFFNKFARMAMLLPGLPLIAGGHTRFQPVYVGDLSEAARRLATLPDAGPDSPAGKIFEFGGPEIVDFRGIYEKIAQVTDRKRILFNLPAPLAKLQAAFFSVLPNPPLTIDQIKSLETDNILSNREPGFAELGIEPTSLDAILPTYLSQYRRGGRFAERKRA